MYTYQWFNGASEDYSDSLFVRRKVFIEEQGYSEEQEVVPEDHEALHLAIYDEGRVVGSGRLIRDIEPNAAIAGRIALLPEFRGKGLGRYIVDLLTEKAKSLGFEKVYIDSQKYAVPFYAKCGYIKTSVEHPDGHIPHIRMARTFALEGIDWLAFDEFYDALFFCADFSLPENIIDVQADIATLGFQESYINGNKVEDALYAPAWTDYVARDTSVYNYPITDETCHRTYYLHYDLTKLVQAGKNRLAIHLGNGWYGQSETRNEGVTRYGELKLCYKITAKTADGQTLQFTSSEGGVYAKSYIVKTSMYFGETQNFNLYDPKILLPETDISHWTKAKKTETPETLLERQSCPKDGILRKITNPKIIHRFGDLTIYDIGENLAGFAVLRFLPDASPDERITVRYAENLNPDGSLDFSSTGGAHRISVDEFFCGEGEKQDLYPHFLWHAGRYVEVRGAHEFCYFALAATNLPVTAEFKSSDPVLNWLFDAYVRTQQSNIHCCVPSDCPHRERLGYTGDGQLTARACMSVFQAKGLYEKWIRDIADCQGIESGHVQHTAPFYGGGGGPGGWGCAIVSVVWDFYEFTGEESILKRYYMHMKKYIDYMQTRCVNHLVEFEEKGGWCLGDWCTPNGDPEIPEDFVNTYFLIRSIRQTAKAAKIIGMDEDIPVLENWEKAHREAMKSQFFDEKTGSFCQGVEGADAFAVDLGLGDERTLKNLVEKYARLGNYDTGIFGTDILTRVLFENHQESLAYRLMSGRGENSFGHMMEEGATTIWEYWQKKHSSNHPMFGAVTVYLFSYILGIRQEKDSVGYQKPLISPAPIPELDYAKGSMKTPIGKIKVEVKKGKLVNYEILRD